MILALDYGDRWIGLALGDPPHTPVHRYGVIDQKTTTATEHIRQIVLKEVVKKVLVGVPLSLEGNETEQTHKSLAFIEDLREGLSLGVEVVGVDETLTSVEARRVISYEGGNAEDEHAEAARLMLADYFKQRDQ